MFAPTARSEDAEGEAGGRRRRRRPRAPRNDVEDIKTVAKVIQQFLLVSPNEAFRQQVFDALSVAGADEARDKVKRNLSEILLLSPEEIVKVMADEYETLRANEMQPGDPLSQVSSSVPLFGSREHSQSFSQDGPRSSTGLSSQILFRASQGSNTEVRAYGSQGSSTSTLFAGSHGNLGRVRQIEKENGSDELFSFSQPSGSSSTSNTTITAKDVKDWVKKMHGAKKKSNVVSSSQPW